MTLFFKKNCNLVTILFQPYCNSISAILHGKVADFDGQKQCFCKLLSYTRVFYVNLHGAIKSDDDERRKNKRDVTPA